MNPADVLSKHWGMGDVGIILQVVFNHRGDTDIGYMSEDVEANQGESCRQNDSRLSHGETSPGVA